ncbi:MAG: hypothetical protein HY005_01785 [Candidatus Staskawiczbacteria bacterium]|nr:hypothetical protein [Candidatus Staskawiczbacteria bacterium]
MSNATAASKIKREDLRLVLFLSSEEEFKARELFGEDKEFQNVPCEESPAPLSLIMTSQGINLLKKKQKDISFKVFKPAATDDLTPEQMEIWKGKKVLVAQLMFHMKIMVTFFVEGVSFIDKKEGLYVKTEET